MVTKKIRILLIFNKIKELYTDLFYYIHLYKYRKILIQYAKDRFIKIVYGKAGDFPGSVGEWDSEINEIHIVKPCRANHYLPPHLKCKYSLEQEVLILLHELGHVNLGHCNTSGLNKRKIYTDEINAWKATIELKNKLKFTKLKHFDKQINHFINYILVDLLF